MQVDSLRRVKPLPFMRELPLLKIPLTVSPIFGLTDIPLEKGEGNLYALGKHPKGDSPRGWQFLSIGNTF